MSSRSSSNAGGNRRSGRSSPYYERDVEANDDTYIKQDNSYSPSSASSTSTPSQADPGEAIQFSQLSRSGSGRRSLSPKSRQSSASPTNEQIPQNVVPSRGGISWPQDRHYGFLTNTPTISNIEPTIPKENEKLMQLRKRKESKEKKKEKNVKNSFVSGGPVNLDIDKFLESIGEKVDKKKKSGKDKKGLSGADKSGTSKNKNRKVTASEPIQNEATLKNQDGKGSSKKKEKVSPEWQGKERNADPEVSEPAPSPSPVTTHDVAPTVTPSDPSVVIPVGGQNVNADADSHKVQDVGKYRNAVVVQADMKQQNSADNLTADTFTKVTSKKQKWKKKSPSTDEQQATTTSPSVAPTSSSTSTTANSQPQASFPAPSSNRSRNSFNGNGRSTSRANQGQQQNMRNNHHEITRTSSTNVATDSKKEKDASDQIITPSSQLAATTSTSAAPETVKKSGHLDLVADFPPLDPGGGPIGGETSTASVPATSTETSPSESSKATVPPSVSSVAARTWPFVSNNTVATNIPHSSDLSAVITNTKNKASEKKVNPPNATSIKNDPSKSTAAQTTSNNSYSSALMANRFNHPPPPIPPPDVAEVTNHNAALTMPDVTSQLPPPPQISGVSSTSNSGQNTPKSNKASDIYDYKNVNELCNNVDRAYNHGAGLSQHQQQQSQPAVTICGRGGGDPVDDWSTTDGAGFEFGGPVSGDLVSMGAIPLQRQRPSGDETLHHLDDAIVCYGERMDENQLHINEASGGELIWNSKQHNNVVQKTLVNGTGNGNEDEEDEGVGGSESWPSGRTTPEEQPLPSAPSAAVQVNQPPKDLNLNFNYEAIVAFIHDEWLKVTKINNIKYYTPSNNNSTNIGGSSSNSSTNNSNSRSKMQGQAKK